MYVEKDWTVAEPKHEWLIEGWLPKSLVTTLWGNDLHDTSALALQLATAAAAQGRKSWIPVVNSYDIGFPIEFEGAVIYAGYGRDKIEIHRFIRQYIHDLDLSVVRNLGYVDMDFHGPICRLTAYEATGQGLTDAGLTLRQVVAQERASLVIIDSLAGAYEGGMSGATRFMSYLNGWAKRTGLSVLLLCELTKTENRPLGPHQWTLTDNPRESHMRLKVAHSVEGGRVGPELPLVRDGDGRFVLVPKRTSW